MAPSDADCQPPGGAAAGRLRLIWRGRFIDGSRRTTLAGVARRGRACSESPFAVPWTRDVFDPALTTISGARPVGSAHTPTQHRSEAGPFRSAAVFQIVVEDQPMQPGSARRRAAAFAVDAMGGALDPLPHCRTGLSSGSRLRSAFRASAPCRGWRRRLAVLVVPAKDQWRVPKRGGPRRRVLGQSAGCLGTARSPITW